MKALSLCKVYKAVADDCGSSLGAVAMMSVACVRAARDPMRAVIHDDDDLSCALEHRAWTNRKDEPERDGLVQVFQTPPSSSLDFITFKGKDRTKFVTTKMLRVMNAQSCLLYTKSISARLPQTIKLSRRLQTSWLR